MKSWEFFCKDRDGEANIAIIRADYKKQILHVLWYHESGQMQFVHENLWNHETYEEALNRGKILASMAGLKDLTPFKHEI